MASFWNLAAKVERDERHLWLCLCKVVFSGRVHYLASLYETFSGSAFFFSSMCVRITLIFFSMRKDKYYLLYIPDETLIFLIINEPILSPC